MEHLLFSDQEERNRANRLKRYKLRRRGTKSIRRNKDLALRLIGSDVLITDKVSYDDGITRRRSCGNAENYNMFVLYPDIAPEYYRRGAMVVIDDRVVGYIKFKGFRTLLCTRSVQDLDGNFPMLRGVIYEVPGSVLAMLPTVTKPEWAVMELDNLSVFDGRFYRPDNYYAPQYSASGTRVSLEKQIRSEVARVETSLASR
jgi:hypothetical protein